jgi:hypothetical protein
MAAFGFGVLGTIAILATSIPPPPSWVYGPSYLSQARTGIACGALEATQEHLRAGRERAILAAIDRAEREALRSLQRSGIRFGPPERLALEIAAEPKRGPLSVLARPDVVAKVERGVRRCEKEPS